MKTYTFFLDMLTISLLVLAINFNLSDDTILHSSTNRAGITRTMNITWQSLFAVASFCMFLRYVALKVVR